LTEILHSSVQIDVTEMHALGNAITMETVPPMQVEGLLTA